MHIEFDNRDHLADFVRLNEQWIVEHFSLEETDRKLAADPGSVIDGGGHILSLVDHGRVVGVCALFREQGERYQLARMAVDPAARGRGYGDALLSAAVERARADGARSVYLLSNRKLVAAISLYRKHGFTTASEGPHPAYARCDIVMALALDGPIPPR